MVIFSESDKRGKQKNRPVPETHKGQHNRTELLLTTTFTETKGLLRTKKAYYYVQC